MASGGFEAYLGDFRPNSPGIVDVFTSSGMQAVLAEATSRLEGQANAAAHLSGDRGSFTPLYEGGVDVLSHTAVGYVTTANVPALVDQASHHTLDGINH